MALTKERLKQLLRYEPKTGIFYPMERRRGVRFGVPAGAKSTSLGYILICVDRVHYCAHRLAWLYMTGKWPKNQIDHKDGSRDNNRWENLREATVSQNRCNAKIRSDNTSGYKGVHRGGSTGNRWRAAITINGKRYIIGYFDDPGKAFRARTVALRKFHGEFARAQ